MDKATKALGQRVTALEKRIHKLTSTPRKYNQESITQQHDPNQESVDTPRTPTVIPPPPSDPDKSEYSRDTTIPWWKRIGGLPWKKILEVVAIFAGIGYAWVTYLQWRDLRQNFRTEQRSWLKVAVAFPETLSETDDFVPEQVENIGKGVARDAVVSTIFEIVDKDRKPSFNPDPSHMTSYIGVIFPGDKVEFPVRRTEVKRDASPKKLMTSDIQDLTAGKTYIAIFGQANYVDQFDQPHWTRFCMWKAYGHNPVNSLSCVQYNSVGDGKPPHY